LTRVRARARARRARLGVAEQIEFAGFTCPLTLLENGLRRRAGEPGYSGVFIDHWITNVRILGWIKQIGEKEPSGG
jgi:hypothetical protein